MVELKTMFAKLSLYENGGFLVELQAKPILLDEFKLKQYLGSSLVSHVKLIEEGRTSDFKFNLKGDLCFHGRYCVPSDK